MATPTPTTYTEWNGSVGMTYWDAVWSTTDNFTDEIIVDISTLTGVGQASAPTAVKVNTAYLAVNGDISATLEYDATTDQLIWVSRNQTDSALRDSVDFRSGPSGGRKPTTSAAGFVGDIILTTANVASGDELTLLLVYERKT